MMQREGLIGMAIAEGTLDIITIDIPTPISYLLLAATRLWQYSGRSMDAYGQRAACEAAAATAAVLADRVRVLIVDVE